MGQPQQVAAARGDDPSWARTLLNRSAVLRRSFSRGEGQAVPVVTVNPLGAAQPIGAGRRVDSGA
jgi:hypothetical protein